VAWSNRAKDTSDFQTFENDRKGWRLEVLSFAQKGGDKRPHKDENKVVVQPKGEKPPPSNSNNQGNKGGDKKKP